MDNCWDRRRTKKIPRPGPRLKLSMIETNLESIRYRQNRNHLGRCGQEITRVGVFLVALLVLFPVCLAAQTTSQTSLAPSQGSPYGTGGQIPLLFEGESARDNQISLTLGASAFYDDNVLGRNNPRLGDEGMSFTADLAAQKQTSNLIFTFDYTPYFMLYRQTSQYDRLNHVADLGLEYRLSPRVVLGLHDYFSYQNGVFPSLSGQPILSGPNPPTGSNSGIYAYTTRNLSNTGGFDLTFVKSRRNSVTLSAGYNFLRYGNQSGGPAALYNSRGMSGGVQYQYRVTDHTTIGVLALHQDNTFTGGVVFGSRLRDQIESGYVSLGSRLSPTLSVMVFGGPQYIRVLGAPAGVSTLNGHFQGAFGGSLTKQARATAFDISFDRSVTDSRGLYTSVINTNVGLGVRRHIIGRWDGNLHANAYRVSAALFQQSTGATNAVTAGIDFTRPVRERSKLRISYDCIHQMSSGNLPYFQSFDRNEVTIGIDFQVKAISLGQ